MADLTTDLTNASLTVEHKEQIAATWTTDQVELMKRTVAEGTTDDEFSMFLHYCKESGLDPLRKQAYCIVREWTDKRGTSKRQTTMMTGIDGFRSRAESFPDFLGCSSAVVFEGDEFSINYGANEVNHIAKFPRTKTGPIGAWAIVRRVERSPYIHWLSWPEIFDNFSPMHKKMPEVMAKKTVEAQAIRHEYPEPFGGIYDPSEIPREGERILSAIDNGNVGQPAVANALPSTAINQPETDVQHGRETAVSVVDGDRLADTNEPPAVDVHEPAQLQQELETPQLTEALPEPPTDAQLERWVELTDWAENSDYMTKAVHEDALRWIDGPPKPSTRAVGAKIGVWKARQERHEAEYENMLAVIKDSDTDTETRKEATERLKTWVMNPKTKVEGRENGPAAIAAYVNDHQDLPL